MSKIRELEYSEKIDKKWRQVFIGNDPFKDPFSKSVTSRIIFYPTYGYHLTEAQYRAFSAALRRMGISEFYLSIIEFSGAFLEKGRHWFCELPSYKQYLQLPLTLENCIYSKEGIFGIMISHEDHAWIGGKGEFVNTVKAEYKTWKNDIRNFEKHWPESVAEPVLKAIDHY